MPSNRLYKLGSRKSALWMKKHRAKLAFQKLLEANVRDMQWVVK